MLLYSWFKNLGSRSWSWFILSGLCFALAQVTAPLWWLTILGFVPLILGLQSTKSLKGAVGGGFMVGTMKALGGYAWIWSVYPLVWLDIDSAPLQFCLIGLMWITTAVFLGFGIVVVTAVFHRLNGNSRALIALFPLMWLAGEVAGSFFQSVWLLGPGSYLNASMSHGYAGLPLAHLSFFAPVAAIGGLYALTYVSALLGGAAALLTRSRKEGIICISVVILLLLALHFFYPLKVPEPLGETVVAVESSFTAASQQTRAGLNFKSEEMKRAVEAALQLETMPDFILLPEDSRVTGLFDSPEATSEYFQKLAPGAKTIIVDSARTDIGEGNVALRAYYYDLSTGHIYMVDKQFLVPQGEYVTYPFRLLLRLLGMKETLALIDVNQNYVPGPITDYSDLPDNLPAVLFCFDSSTANAVHEIVNEHPTRLLLHQVSHGRFNNPKILWYQTSSMLQAAAIWGGVSIVSAVNMGESQQYNADSSVNRGEEILKTAGWSLVGYSF